MMNRSVFCLRVFRRFKTFHCAAVHVKNEPVLGFEEGSVERKELLKVRFRHIYGLEVTLARVKFQLLCFGLHVSFQALDGLKGHTEEIPCVVGDEHVWTKDIRYQPSVSKVNSTFGRLSSLLLHLDTLALDLSLLASLIKHVSFGVNLVAIG